MLVWTPITLMTSAVAMKFCPGSMKHYRLILLKWSNVVQVLFQFYFVNLHIANSFKLNLHNSFFFCFFKGACFCQLMDLLFPESIDMSKVKFESQKRSDFKQNYSLLQTAFRKSGIKQVNLSLFFSSHESCI